MSGGLKQQWGVGDPAQVGPDAQSQDLKAAFEKPMDAMAEHLQFTAANGERARHDPLAARSEALVPRYQAALGEVDPADPAKAKSSIDSLLADTESLGQEVAAFRSETEKAAAEWQSRSGSYDAAVVQVEELQQWQHPKEAPLRGLVDGIRANVNDRAYAKAIAVLDQFLPKLQPIYEDFQRQKAAQQEYEPASAALQPRLVQAAQPTFAKLAPQQSEIAAGQSTMEASAQGRDFVAALATVSTLGGRVDTYTAAVEELTRLKQEYEQALAQVQPKLQAAPNPSPFQKLASQQAELASGQQQMETAAQAEEFEQALQQANDLGTKADAYTAAVEELTRLKQEYEQALAQVQPKLQAAPNPSPFQKLAAQQAELASGQQQMESAAQAEEFEQALQQANDLGTKAEAYTAAVEELTRLKQEYEQALAQVQPKLQAAPNPSPFQKLAAQQGELESGQQQMETAAQAEEFEQALQQANELGTKADAYTAAVEELTRLKQEYEQALSQVQPKLQAAPNPSPFQKLAAQQGELASGQQQMESAAQAEEFEQALQQATELGTKADAYTAAVEELTRLKQEYEQALSQVQPKLQAAPNPSPFQKLASQQGELASGQQQMESAAQAEEFEQALQQANDLGTKAEAYTAAVEELTRLKQEYEQALAQVQPKLQAAPNPSPFNKLSAQQAELTSGQQQMESAAQAEEFEQALSQANELGTKADAYTAAVEELTRLKQEYEQALAQVQPKLQAAPNPSPFQKLAAQQGELASGQQQMESAAQAEEFEQALQQANELGTKADVYTAAVEELTRLKQEYEQALSQVQPKLQAAPNPSPFQKLASQQGELASGQQQMETAAQAEEFEQALSQANELGTKVDAYTAAVEELTRLKQEYEQALAQVQPKLQAAPNPSPFQKLASQQGELASGQQQMETAAQAEEFEQALQQANELGTKADVYTAAVEELTRLKQEYEQALAQVQPKLQAAPNPSPFNKLSAQQAELTSGQQQMESAAQAEEFEQALQQANDLGTKADAYTAAVEELTRLKQEYEQALAQVQPKLQAAPNPSPFQKLAAQQGELASGQQQMETAAQSEEFEQALQQANELGTKADAYTAAVEELTRLKQEYEQTLAQVQPKLQATPNPSPFQKLASQQGELASGQQQMESAAQAEEFEQALQQANDLGTKADAYTAAVEELQRLKQEYEAALAALKPKLADASRSQGDQPTKLLDGVLALQAQMAMAADGGDFEQALKLAQELDVKLDSLAKAAGGDPEADGSGAGAGGGGSAPAPGPSGGSGGGSDGTPTLVIDEFAFDHADIPAQHLSSLEALRTSLSADPAATVLVLGHTDTVGTERYNDKLGRSRASAIMKYLSSKGGIEAKRIKVDSRGEKRSASGEPEAKVDPDPGQRNPKNRRAEIFVTQGAGGVTGDLGTAVVDAGEAKKKPTSDSPPTKEDPNSPATPEPTPGPDPKDAPTRKPSEVLGANIDIEVTLPGRELPALGGRAKITFVWQFHLKAQINDGGEDVKVAADFNSKKFGAEWGHTWWDSRGGSQTAVGDGFFKSFSTKSLGSVDTKGRAIGAGFVAQTSIGEFEIDVTAETDGPHLKGGYVSNKAVISVPDQTFMGVRMSNIQIIPIAGQVDITPNYAQIAIEIAEKQGVRVAASAAGGGAAGGGASTATAIVTFDAVIGAGLVLVAVGVVAGTVNELAKAANEAQLNQQIDLARTSFGGGIDIALRGADQPGNPWQAAGWRVGRSVFDEVVKQIKDKFPDARPDEIHAAAIDWLKSPSHRAKNIDSPQVRAKIQHMIGDGFWSSWIESNHGVGTFLGDAKRVCGRCFGRGIVADDDPDLQKWKDKSDLPAFMK